MGFAENLSTLAMNENERNTYYQLANSDRPEDRARARQMINGGDVTPLELYGIYKQSKASAILSMKQEQLQDMKNLIQNETRNNPQYVSLDPEMQGRIKDAYKVKEALIDDFSDILPEENLENNEMNGPEFG